MNPYSFVPKFIEELEELILRHYPNRQDVAWDGGELNSFLTQIEDVISEFNEECEE